MRKAQAIIDIGIRGAKNMRHIGIVSGDFDRGGNPRDRMIRVIIGQGPRGQPIGQPNAQDRDDHKGGHEFEQQRKNAGHGEGHGDQSCWVGPGGSAVRIWC